MKKLSQPPSQQTSHSMAAAPISNASKKLTPAEQLAENAGLSIDRICKRARIGKQHFANIARHGTNSIDRAEIMARICKCPEMVFLWGLPEYQRLEAGRVGAGGMRTFQPEPVTAGQRTVVADRPRRNQSPALTKI